MNDITICYILSGAPSCRCEGVEFSENRFVICADAGVAVAAKIGIKPDVVIGDFDAYSGELPKGAKIIRRPPEKDDTDTMLAVKYALDRGFEHIVICGAVGGRLDHTMANIQALRYIMEHGAYGELAGDGNFAVLQGEGTRLYRKRDGYYFSLISLSKQCVGLSESGVKYPLENAVLESSFPLGVSNEITGECAEVTLKKGLLLVIFSKDMNQNL